MELLNNKTIHKTVHSGVLIDAELVVQDSFTTELISVPTNQFSVLVQQDGSSLAFLNEPGLGIEDPDVLYGRVYIEEIEDTVGHYHVRFRLKDSGSYMVVVNHDPTGSSLTLEIIVTQLASTANIPNKAISVSTAVIREVQVQTPVSSFTINLRRDR